MRAFTFDMDRVHRESERESPHLLEGIADAFQLFDADWHITHMNAVARAFWRGHGMDPESMIGKHFWEDLFPEAKGRESAAHMYRAMEERVSVSFDYFHEPWGIWLRSRFDPLPDGGLANYFDDVTERVRTENALRRSERDLGAELDAMARLQEVSTRMVQADDPTSLLQEIVDAAITITSADMGNIQLRNRVTGALEMVASRGFQPEFLQFFATVHRNEGACGAALRHGGRVIVEDVERSEIFADAAMRRAVLAAGARAVQSTPLVTRSGKLVGMLSTHCYAPHRPGERDLRLLDLLARQAADWIERQQVEEAVRESEVRYRSLVSQVKDYAIFSMDADGVVGTWNEGCQHVLGYTEEEFVALDAHELFVPEDRAAGVLEQQMRELAETGTARDDRWMVAKGGRRFFAMGAAAARRDAAGRLLDYSIVIRDVTQMRLAQEELAHRGESLERLVSERTSALERAIEQLRHSERMAALGTLAAGLGHDLGNLLLPLDARLQILGQADLPADLREHVTGIESCVHYLRRLSSGLRLLATSPRASEPPEPTELGDWWEEIGSLLKNVLPYGVAFESHVPRAGCWVAMGRVPLTQAVFNLVQNAADAVAGRGGAGEVRVCVEDARSAGSVIISVADDGPGMTEEVVRRCLEPYFSTKTRAVSTGMGLALVRALVTGVGGRVEVESTLGVGTTVSLVLHAATGQGEARPARRRRARAAAVRDDRRVADSAGLRADVHGDVSPTPLIES